MAEKSLANLTLTVDPAALREIIGKGELLKFADAVAAEAAAQITAQIVWHVAEAQTQNKAATGAGNVVANLAFHRVVGDGEPGFGTTGGFPPRVRG